MSLWWSCALRILHLLIGLVDLDFYTLCSFHPICHLNGYLTRDLGGSQLTLEAAFQSPFTRAFLNMGHVMVQVSKMLPSVTELIKEKFYVCW